MYECKEGNGAERRLSLQATDRRRHLGSDHVNNTLPNLTPIQLHEGLLSEVETSAGGVDGGDIDPRARSGVSHVPAPAAIGRVPDDVKGASDERERGDAAERRESVDEAVRPVRARYAIERAARVVERVIVRGAQGRWRR